MNPHAPQPTSLVSCAKNIWQHRQLIKQMAWREILGRYKGSLIGLLWSLIIPVVMLAVYTFIFSFVFKARWGIGTEESKVSFALILFAGLITHGLLAEILNRAPSLILNNINYVKKVTFPLEILPVISLLAAFFHSAVSLIVLMIALVTINGYLQWTVIFIPIVLLPLATLLLGLSWILASLGVFIRDIAQIIGIVTTIMLFMTPIFYPLSILPDKYHPFILANPLTFIVEQAREVLIFGHPPNWFGLGIYMVAALAVSWMGYGWFQKTRKGFADVI